MNIFLFPTRKTLNNIIDASFNKLVYVYIMYLFVIYFVIPKMLMILINTPENQIEDKNILILRIIDIALNLVGILILSYVFRATLLKTFIKNIVFVASSLVIPIVVIKIMIINLFAFIDFPKEVLLPYLTDVFSKTELHDVRYLIMASFITYIPIYYVMKKIIAKTHIKATT